MAHDTSRGREWLGGCVFAVIALCACGWLCALLCELPALVDNVYTEWRTRQRLPKERARFNALLDDLAAVGVGDDLLWENITPPYSLTMDGYDYPMLYYCTGYIRGNGGRVYGTERPFEDILADLRAVLQRREGRVLAQSTDDWGSVVFEGDNYRVYARPHTSKWALDPLAWKLFPMRWHVGVSYGDDPPDPPCYGY